MTAVDARRLPLMPGDQIEARVDSGHSITLTYRPDELDYRVTVMLMDHHAEHPRHFPTEYLARQHARHLTSAYRPTNTPVFTIVRLAALAAA